MDKKTYLQAIEIISEYHTSKITINQPKDGFVGSMGIEKWTIHITKCVPGCVEKLIKSGFHLSMNEDGLQVDKLY